MDVRSSHGVVVVAFLLAVLIGSGNFVAVSFSNQELDPFWGAGFRFGLAGLLFVIVSLTLRLRWPRGRTLRVTAMYGLFTFALSYALIYWALTQMTAGAAAVVFATVPLATPLLAAAHRLEALDRRALVGAAIAFVGIAWMTVGTDGLEIPLGAIVATVAAAFTVGESFILSKRIASNHPAMNNAIGMVVAAPVLLLMSLVVGETWALPSEQDTVVALIYLVTIGSIGLFVLTLIVVRHWTASAAAYMFVLFPVGALLLDALLLDEPLTMRALTGSAVVITGVWFGALAPRRDEVVDVG